MEETNQYWNAKGFNLMGDNQFEEALAAFSNAIRLEPNDYSSFYGLGIVHLQMSQFQNAIQAFVESARLNPEFGNVWQDLGITYLKIGKYDEAEQAILNSIKILPSASKWGRPWSHLSAKRII